VLPEETHRKIKELSQGIRGMPSEMVMKKAPVTAIRPKDVSIVSPLIVTAGGKDYTFTHAISTVPLTSFAMIDTSGLAISPMQRSAIRQLQYGPATKTGMRFESAWWKEDKQIGGQSFTDLPIRTVVYPSYGDNQESNVLLSSYCWTGDAEKLGSLINAQGADDAPIDARKALDELVLRDLAAVHEVDVEFLCQQHIETHSWDWNHSPWAGGACRSSH
jgi:monoamine oxidase